YALLAINWLAVAGGTLVVAGWLRRRGLPVWFALVYGLYPGLLLGVKNDLTEPLCYGLVALAIYLFEFGGNRGLVWSACAFALATLTRETAAVFPLCYALPFFIQNRRAGEKGSRALSGICFLGISLGPLLLYKQVLAVTLGSTGFASWM